MCTTNMASASLKLEDTIRGKKRNHTNKHWCFLFLIVFVIWVSCLYTGAQQLKILKDNIIPTNKQDTEATKPVTSYLWGNNWLFDALTFNPAFLGTHYNERENTLLISTIVTLSILIIIYSLWSICRNDHLLFNLFSACATSLLPVILLQRILICPDVVKKIMHWWLQDNDFRYFILPAFIVVVLTLIKRNQHFIDRDSQWLAMDYRRHYYFLPMRVVVIMWMMIYYPLIKYTQDIVNQLGWDNQITYGIVGGGVYVSLTLYYVVLMAISFALGVEIEAHFPTGDDTIPETSLFNAALRVIRYHFGTACYHATLIFPRLQSLRVTSEMEFKGKARLTNFCNRFYVSQFQLHNLTLIGTSIDGTNHSESLRKLIRKYTDNSCTTEWQCFQGYSWTGKYLSALLLSINSLALISFWALNLREQEFLMTTWFVYVSSAILLWVLMRFSDAVTDTMLFYFEFNRCAKDYTEEENHEVGDDDNNVSLEYGYSVYGIKGIFESIRRCAKFALMANSVALTLFQTTDMHFDFSTRTMQRQMIPFALTIQLVSFIYLCIYEGFLYLSNVIFRTKHRVQCPLVDAKIALLFVISTISYTYTGLYFRIVRRVCKRMIAKYL